MTVPLHSADVMTRAQGPITPGQDSSGESNHFGRLLRFWRGAFGLSQEDLAYTANISVRHLSFLETGKAQPSRALIARITTELKLGRRDSGNLLQAAGYLPVVEIADLDDPGHEELRRDLIATLRCFDPFPAAAIDPFANVKMVNKAWVHMHRQLLGDAIMRPDLNSIRLLVSEDGWRRYMPDWAQVVCLYLVILQQEAILRDSIEAQTLLDEILAIEGVPADWGQRGARTPSDGHNHRQPRAQRPAGLYQCAPHRRIDGIRIRTAAYPARHPAGGWRAGDDAGSTSRRRHAAASAARLLKRRPAPGRRGRA